MDTSKLRESKRKRPIEVSISNKRRHSSDSSNYGLNKRRPPAESLTNNKRRPPAVSLNNNKRRPPAELLNNDKRRPPTESFKHDKIRPSGDDSSEYWQQNSLPQYLKDDLMSLQNTHNKVFNTNPKNP